jgi:hypothetical protein
LKSPRLALLLALAAPAVALAQDAGNPVDSRVGESYNAAESYQGPLDGSWTLVSATSGQAILAFQLVDKASAREPLEGVWRDLRHPAVPGDIGFIDSLVRSPGSLIITLNATPSTPPVTISLTTGPDGAWTGTMREGSAAAPVKLRRG